jgi:TFIIF-interacting CTD phosphatase-like protein
MPTNLKKPNILLDLDQTIISSEASDELDIERYKEKSKLFRSDNMDGYYVVYSRPYLQEFLDYIFSNFNVSVWTAASKDYALFIIEKIILNNKPERKLDYIFFSYHCKWSKAEKKYTKKLEMIWDIYKLPGYNSKNTVILDDYKKDVHKSQPNNCIIAPPFEFTKESSEHDTFLKDIIPDLKKLEKRIQSGDSHLTNIVNSNMKTI